MTLAEFDAVCRGFAESNGAKDETPTDEDYAAYEAAFAHFHSIGMT